MSFWNRKMPQLYIFIITLAVITIIIARRSHIFDQDKQLKFREEVSKKVDELQKERQETEQRRFKDIHLNEQKNKKYDFSQFKLTLRKADMAMAKEQWNEAKKCLIQSLALTRDEFPISLKLAKVYMESGDLKRSEALYRRLLEVDKNQPIIYENLAKIYSKKKNYKEAIEAYVQSIELNESNDKALIGLGNLYQMLMRHSLAAECFRRAAELKPREVHYLFCLADACKAAEDYENALFTYERILTMEPYNEKAQNSAQDVRIRINEIEKAILT